MQKDISVTQLAKVWVSATTTIKVSNLPFMINFAKKKTQNDILGQTAMDPNLQAVTVKIQFLDLANSQNQNIICCHFCF